MRAFRDKRVKRSHLSVLGVVSHFDRFGRNGSGCYATQERIAELAGCTATTVSKRIGDLCGWGYLSGSRQSNRRRMQYRVIHDTCPPEQLSDGRNSRSGQASGHNTCSVGQTKRFPKGVSTDSSGKPMRNSPHFTKNIHAEAGGRPSLPRLPAPDKAADVIPDSEFWRYHAQIRREIQIGRKFDETEAQIIEGVYNLLLEHGTEETGLEMVFESLLSDIDEKYA